MYPTLVIVGCMAAFVALAAVIGFKMVRHAETMVVERLGRYHRTLESGINILWPVVDRTRQINWRYMDAAPDGSPVVINRRTDRIDLRETVYDFPRQNVITRDNVAIAINALVYFQVVDPMRSVYEITNLPDAIEKLTQTTLRNVIGELDLDETLVSRDTINKRLGAILDDATNKWGVKVNRVELQDIMPPQDVQEAMEKQMRAERERRAVVLTASGQKESAILSAEGVQQSEIKRAEGDKQAAVLRATGEAAAMIQLAQAESEAIGKIVAAMGGSHKDASAYLIAIRYINALKTMASGDQSRTVYLPYEATGVMGALGGMKDLFGPGGGATPGS
jgi:regulator of protease activity HflC (stomatin/prohibitin superfamily)